MMTPTSTRDFPHLPHRHDAPLRLRPIPYWLTLAFIGSSLLGPASAQAALTDLASSPMVTSSASSVLPNLMFILDDSGSMGWSYMPDTVGNNFDGDYGYSSAQCNGVYYDPNVTYLPPVDANGTVYPNATFTAAWVDGYKPSAGTVNLSTSFRVDSELNQAPAFYYNYTGTQTTTAQKNYYSTSSTFYRECNSQIGDSSSPGYTKFSKVVVGASEQQNFANWYSYYRTRMLMMKTAVGRAFLPIDNRYRVGYMTLNNNTGSDFLNITTFDASQKAAWYATLYAAKPSSGTPLRDALSKAGKLYAGKLNTINGQTANDPVQYSCQQNFTLLSTDGFWNGAAGSKLDGSGVGNQDGSVARPQLDGATTTYQKTTTQLTTGQSRLTLYTSQTQKRTSRLQRKTGTLQKRTSNSSGASWSSWSNTGSCTWDNTSSSRTQCRYNWSGWNNVSSCTVAAEETDSSHGARWSGNASDCQYTAWSSWAGDSSCTAAAQSPGPTNYSVGTATECQTLTNGPNPVSSCAPYAAGTTAASSGNNWTQATCATNTIQAATPVETCTPEAASAANGYVATTCDTITTGPTTVYSCLPDAATVANDWTATSCSAATASGGTSDTLADVAQYYYMTDLRTAALGNQTGALGVDVSTNNVPGGGTDAAAWQHMTTFTLGLGARGRMVYNSAYETATSGDFHSVKTGAIANPTAGVCSWQGSGSICNWPTPGADKPENIDDLWHAAVNGRGKYFAATDPMSLASSITEALAGVSKITAASAAATTSNPNVTSGDNFVFESTFLTQEWHGELVRRQLDLSTGRPLATTDWSARDQLDSNASRTIYTYSSSGVSGLKPFTWASLDSTEQGYFSLASLGTLSQFCSLGPNCLSAASQSAAAGANLVNFLRGDRSHEGPADDPTTYYRPRQHLLGDIVNAEAVYVRSSLYNYADAGYSTYKSSNTSRQGMVYVAANDGMLHAFNADTGAEAWAYVPHAGMANLYKLADKEYASKHQFFLDGTPTIGDVVIGGGWKTLLVAGMNAGGRGYYAMDVSDPAAPKALWEFTHANLGYTYGNPVITKLKDGTWVVIVASGYNNVTPGDGVGRLFILDAATGTLIRSISTGVGSSTTPSGLARINAWVENSMTDNTALRVYGGDLLGNVWRFDINDDIGTPGYDAQLLVTLKDPAGTVQPLTAKPELGQCGSTPLVLIGSGRFLGTADLASSQQQSFYGIKDKLDTSTLTTPRQAGSGFVQQVMTDDTCGSNAPGGICTAGEAIRKVSDNPVNYASDHGWYVDFLESGERATTDPTLALGTLTFNTNIPNSSACSIGGDSYINYLNYCDGSAVSTADDIGSVKLGNALATRPVVVVLPNNALISLSRLADGTTVVRNQPPPSQSGTTRRVSWRELVNDQ